MSLGIFFLLLGFVSIRFWLLRFFVAFSFFCHDTYLAGCLKTEDWEYLKIPLPNRILPENYFGIHSGTSQRLVPSLFISLF